MYLKQFQTQVTPQSEPIPGVDQVQNNAGGYTFAVDDWTRLDRFLIQGSEGNTYYVSERPLTLENAEAVMRCIKADGKRVVRTVSAISTLGRAPKNDPALFALALCASYGDAATRKLALEALPQVARTGTHLLHFAAFVDAHRGWGRGLRQAIADWYAQWTPASLAYQLVKYQQRDGWSHRDLLRLAHPVGPSVQHRALYHWATKGWESVGAEPHPDEALRLVWAAERLKGITDAASAASMIREYRLPREAVPSTLLASPVVWRALLDDMPMTALIRNLGTLSKLGLLSPLSDALDRVCKQLTDETRIRAARVHPLAVLVALKTYGQGHGERGSNTWTPNQQVLNALDSAFYLAFQNVEATKKRWLLGVDVSGSMNSGTIAGMPGITPRIGAAALALVTAATEPQHHIMGFSHQFIPLPISPRQRLDDVIKTMTGIPFGATDCALPMVYAQQEQIPVDVFVVLTDNETWFGKVHPVQALQAYRKAINPAAKLVVISMTPTGFSIADPNDAGMLDISGFDAAVPQVLADFATR